MKVIKDYPFALTVNSILDGINRDFGSLRWSSASLPQANLLRLGEPSLREHEDHYLLKFLLPGFNKKDLSLQIEGQTLVLRFENNTPNQGGMYQDSGPWSGSVQIPEDAETKRASAKLTDGVLSVTIPKQKKAKPIEVRIS